MMRKLRFLILAMTLAIGCLGAQKLSTAQFEHRIFELTNAQRIKHGLKPLVYETGLADLARRHSTNMAKHKYFDHTDREGLDVSGRKDKYYPELMSAAIGENLAYNEVPNKVFNPAEIVTGWMNSPGHREIILTPGFTHLGVGVVLSGTKLYSTQNFSTAIVKLKNTLPKTLSKNKRYVLSFEYLSPQARKGFSASLRLPDPNTVVELTERTFTRGYAPLQPVWKSETEFTLTLDLKYGKGEYVLNFGWDGLFYDRCYVLRVK